MLTKQRLGWIGLIALAAIGAALLLDVAVIRWGEPQDEHAYWLAARHLIEGQPLYDPSATAVTPYAYWYPPIVAQVLVPVALVLPSEAFSWAWTALLLTCLLWMARWRVLVALAYVAFVPVAVELWYRNVHLVLAALLVAGVRTSPFLAVASAIKVSPGLGLAWLAARGRWRAAGAAAAVGAAILAVSVVLSPGDWVEWVRIVSARGPGDMAGFLPVPFLARAVVGLVVVLLAARLRAPWAHVGLVVGVTIALPTLWATALSTLVAIAPMVDRYREDDA